MNNIDKDGVWLGFKDTSFSNDDSGDRPFELETMEQPLKKIRRGSSSWLGDYFWKNVQPPSPNEGDYCQGCRPYFIAADDQGAEPMPVGSTYISKTIDQLLQTEFCNVCRLIYKLLPEVVQAELTAEIVLFYEHRHCQVVHHHNIRGAVLARTLLTGDRSLWEKLGFSSDLDSTMIRKWIKTCEQWHGSGDNARSLSRSPNPVDITLIDVMDGSLVRASTSVRFCALSYVWGRTESLQTTSHNRSVLERPGALRQAQHWNSISRVIRDSIELVAAIGERFLWVDALCIEQDNAALKHSQIMQMDIIYSHALLTIIALCGANANVALTPLRQVRSGDAVPRPNLELQNEIMVGPSLHQSLHDSAYDSRAWTFQERLLSQRCLFFSPNQTFLRCHTQVQSEHPSMRNPDLNDLDILPQTGSQVSNVWCADFSECTDPIRLSSSSRAFDHYTRLLQAYRKKHLSHASDTLNAFSGILAALAKHNQWHFVLGLPEEHFDLALLWSPDASRVVTRNQGFPSWSWAGWDCPVTWHPIAEFWWGAPNIQRARTEIEELQTFYRTPKRSILRAQPSRSQQQLEGNKEEVPVPHDTVGLRAGIDILSFRAQVISFVTFRTAWVQMIGINSQVNCILDFQGRKCGFRYRNLHDVDPPDAAHTELILLSRFQQSETTWTKSRVFSMANGTRELYEIAFDHEAYPFSEWALLNVMFVQQKGEHVERVDIGLMHEKAFNDAGPMKKEVLLA